MGKKKNREVPRFGVITAIDDEKILVQHQKARHFKCHACHKKLSTAGGMAIRVLQVHKETVTKVPNAKPERESTEIEIFGMQGIPPEVLAAHYGEQDKDTPLKLSKVEIPSSNFFGSVVPAAGVAFPPHSTYGAMQPMMAYSCSSTTLVSKAAGSSNAYCCTLAPEVMMQQPLFPIQNMNPTLSSTFPPVLPASFPITPPGLLASTTSPLPVSQPLFPVAGNNNTPVQSSPFSTPALSATVPSSSPKELKNPGETYSSINAPTYNYHASSVQGGPFSNSHSYVSGPNSGGPSIGPPPVISNKAPTTAPAANEVYLVWDDEAMSLEERRMPLLKYQVHDETSQMNSIDATIDRRISEGRLAGRMAF